MPVILFSRRISSELTILAMLIPIIVRGAAAAFLIFLVVMGGIAVFTRADPAPNAYAVFFACFVAAVFSEDVWTWAQRTQAERMRSAAAAGAAAGAAAARDTAEKA